MKKTMKITVGVAVAMLAVVGLHYYKDAHKKVELVEEIDEVEKADPVGPAFNADSAYAFTKAQCDFGPRNMNSRGHDLCGEWIVNKFREYGCKVTTQRANLTGYDGTTLRSCNIMASINPEATTRILLCAHWDSRPWADNDPDQSNWKKPIIAANDAASGVAVMLELARIINNGKAEKALRPQLGVDFVCFDAEDWGTPQWADVPDDADSWALGAQYWSKNLPQGYEARYGILLDMVGGVGAQFFQEGISLQYAPEIVKKVWRSAREVGFGSYFPKRMGGMVTDDHVPVNRYAKIPTIDIIPFYPDCKQSGFGPTWHTLADNMENIDRNTLRAVGQTLVQVIYKEQ
ncbi:M28 family peptidase [Segatella maculosa]|uniref:M28 family peptidase n=1 Tax=Segatella maculosa TaxID=439703 RepID=UPI0028D023A8|nr:M28 family peptidase [Segatella maculosa]